MKLNENKISLKNKHTSNFYLFDYHNITVEKGYVTHHIKIVHIGVAFKQNIYLHTSAIV